MKITPLQLIQLWNTLGDIELINEDAPVEFMIWIKRFRIIVSQEVDLWNILSIAEREVIKDEEIEFSIKKLHADYAPKNIPSVYHEILQQIFDGDLPEYKSKLQQLIELKNAKED